MTPEGLLITCMDGEEALRLRAFFVLLVPERAHNLIEVAGRRVLLRCASRS